MDQDYIRNLILFVRGAIDELCRRGLTTTDLDEDLMTPKGLAVWDQLLANGFVPKRQDVLRYIRSAGLAATGHEDGLTTLIMGIATGKLKETTDVD